jgi:hypothetical protein
MCFGGFVVFALKTQHFGAGVGLTKERAALCHRLQVNCLGPSTPALFPMLVVVMRLSPVAGESAWKASFPFLKGPFDFVLAHVVNTAAPQSTAGGSFLKGASHFHFRPRLLSSAAENSVNLSSLHCSDSLFCHKDLLINSFHCQLPTSHVKLKKIRWCSVEFFLVQQSSFLVVMGLTSGLHTC